MKREYRVLAGAQLRAAVDSNKIGGYAAVFNQLSDDLGGFREKLAKGCFSRCLRGNPDVRCLINHEAHLILGRTKSGTLDLAEDETGLGFECEPGDTQYAKDLRVSIQRRDIDQCSFGFFLPDWEADQAWEPEQMADGTVIMVRTILNADLFDVSPVTYPAYPQTSVDVRSLWPDGMPDGLADRGKAPVVEVPSVNYVLRAEAHRLAAGIIGKQVSQ